MLTHSGQDSSVFTSLGTVNNLAGGSIFGDRFGIILSTGGEVNNDGSISGNVGGVTIQDGVNDGGKTGTIANSGTISGGTSSAVTFGVHLVSNSLENSGTIRGGTSGVITEAGALSLVNTGSIRGDGTGTNANIPDSSSATDTSRADGGVVIAAANSTVTNSGDITGRVHGIAVVPQINLQTGVYQGLASNTTITNFGLIRGETDDGIRLAGGGNVVNSGIIEGLSGTSTDGISAFFFTGQDSSAQPIVGTITNLAGGQISGARIGVLMSKSGVVDNAGSIGGGQDGVFIQNPTGFSAAAASVVNSGSISAGTRGVVFGTSLGSTTPSLLNSGTISVSGTGASDAGIRQFSAGRVTVTNTVSGLITSPDNGINTITGAMTVNNAGQIIATGTGYHAGIRSEGLGLRVTNSGLISGVDGIAALGSGAGDTRVENSGTILGTRDGGLWLNGGGDVTNAGVIEGAQYGIWMDRNGRPLGPNGLGLIVNTATGIITGGAAAFQLSDYTRIENAGTINGAIAARGGVITNTGTINGNVANFTASTFVENYGVINGNLTVGSGIFANIDNYGTMGDIDSLADNNMNNWGTVGTIDFGGYDDLLTLRAGSRVLGDANAYGGNDQLRLDSGTAPVQTLGRFFNFELLNLISGQWDAPDAMGSFGTINITGGKLTLTGELSGTMLISGPGTFQIGAGGSVGGFTGNIANNGSMIVDIGSDYTLASAMSGTGSFQKTGPAMLTLSGTSTHTGPTTVSGGTLAVTGSVASSTLVQTGATLAGTGTLGNVVLQPWATLSPGAGVTPGNGIGTLNLIGSLTFGGGSRLLVNANDAGQADRVNVTGNVTIGPNALVSVLAENGTWNTSTRYVLISVTGRILSSFSGVTSDLVFLEPKLSQNSKIVELTLKRKAVRLNSGAVTINQAGVANALDTMGDSSGLMTAVLGQNALGAQMAFDSLSGGFFGSLSNQLLAGAGRLQTALQPGADVPEAGIASWSGFTPATRSASSGDFRSGFSLAGDGVRLSMAAGWLPQERVATGSNGMATMETHYSGTMLGYAEGGFSAHAGAGFSWHRIIANRNISFPGYADGAQARYRGATQQLFAEVAQQAHLGPLSVTPFAGYSHIRVDGMDIREAGSGAGLLIDGQARRLGLAQLGLRTSAQLPVGGTASLSARLNFAWQRAWGDLDVVQNSRFAGNGAGFVYRGQGLASGGFDIDAGLELQRGPLAFTAGYRRSTVLQRYDDGAEVGMRLRF
jgi:autotransporter-associated beta strand protein